MPATKKKSSKKATKKKRPEKTPKKGKGAKRDSKNWDPLVAFRMPEKLKLEIERVIESGKHHSYTDMSDFLRRAAARELNSYKGNVKRLKNSAKKKDAA